jgi:RNA-splicing ligase RtcB
MASSILGLAEEASAVYREINQVMETAQDADTLHLVARIRPFSAVKWRMYKQG